MTDCAICIDPFNKTKRKPVHCPYCPTDGAIVACIACVKTYLLQDDAPTPRCAACRAGWTEDFMTQTFTKTWLLKEYKAHRERILLDLERARLPEAQEDAARYRRANQLIEQVDAQIAPIQQQIKDLPECAAEKAAYDIYLAAHNGRYAEERKLQRQQQELIEREVGLRILLDPVDSDTDPAWIAEMERLPETDRKAQVYKEYLIIKGERQAKDTEILDRRLVLRIEETLKWREYIDARNTYWRAKSPYAQRIKVLQNREYRNALSIRKSVGLEPVRPAAGAGAETTAVTTRWAFVMKCPRTCEGFVGTNWKCGLCEVQFCKDCGEEEGTEHLCDPDVRATHAALRKEAKPCPKCAAMISKIDGCDQMWCTQCQTAFSWRTGQIESSHIHNPHYFQWMRQNGGAPTRPIGDCLNLEPEELIEQVVHYAMRRRQHNIVEWARQMRHYRWVYRTRQTELRNRQNDDWRRQLRVKRLVNEINDDTWKDRLQRGEKATQKEYAVVQVMDLFLQAGMDILRNTLPDDADIPALLEQYEALRKFCNDEMGKIQKRYNNEVVYITPIRERLY